MSGLSPDNPICFNSEAGASSQTPLCLNWSCEEVGRWIADLGYGDYSPCFVHNSINGRRLILIDASTLPSIGVRDFKHVLDLSERIRGLLGVETPNWRRSLSLPPRSEIGTFLAQKSRSGIHSDKLSFCHSSQSNNGNS